MRNAILISLICLTAYKMPYHKMVGQYNSLTNTDTSRYAIFTLNDDPGLFNKSYKSASLSKQEIDQIEHLIDKEVYKINEDVKKSGLLKFNYIGNPKQYYKQIIPVTNTNGEKEVWVMACKAMSRQVPARRSFFMRRLV